MSKLDQLVGHLSITLQVYSDRANSTAEGGNARVVRMFWAEKHVQVNDILDRLIEAMKEDGVGMYGKKDEGGEGLEGVSGSA